MDIDDEIAFMGLLLGLLLLRRRQDRRQRRVRWRPSYEYRHFSFSLDLMPPGRARAWLRFSVEEIIQLVPLLQLDLVEYRDRNSVDPTTALCIVCARLSSPAKWYPIVDIFGRSIAWLSKVFNDTVLFLAAAFSSSIRWHHQLQSYDRLLEFTRGIEGVCGVQQIWGFVDGTFRGCRRPTDNSEQRLVYSGHKRLHGMNWQAIVTPDGLISSLVGPFAGSVNDWAIWRRSGCEEVLRTTFQDKDILYIYGDPAYSNAYGISCPFEHPQGRRFLPQEKRDFNQALSSVRIAVEQAFGDIQVQWTYTAFAKGLTAGKQPIAAYFTVAVLLTNCYTCIRRQKTRFSVLPPDIEDYLSVYSIPS
jgi:hypothetical protein